MKPSTHFFVSSKANIKNLFAVIFFILVSVSGFAQTFSPDSLAKKFKIFSNWCSPEKLYVHLDRTYFASGETIWFMGYLQNASVESLMKESNYIYAELLDGNGNAATRVKIKRTPDGFPGYLYLPENLKSGEYTFRAYTIWQMNRSEEYMFNQRIRILGTEPLKKETPSPVDSIDISFFPESGRYFAGSVASIGFKAMDKRGRSLRFNGTLKDENGNMIVPAVTRHDGMGQISFIPTPGSKYYVEAENGQTFSLPAPSEEGCSINLRWSNGKYVIRMLGKGGKPYTLLARDINDFKPLANFIADGKGKAMQLQEEFFNPGINHLIMVNAEGKIEAERLFFVREPASITPQCTFWTTNNTPKPHGLINTKLSLKDSEGKPLDGKVSISIVRGSFKSHLQDDGIKSYIELSSELKGHINNPAYYFDNSIPKNERIANLDLLMMIQGWRYYDIEKLTDPKPEKFAINFLKEYYQTIKGRIERTPSSKIPKNFIFSVIIPKLHFKRFISVAQAKYYTLDSLDFEENTQFLINVNRKGIGADFSPVWAGDKFASSYKYFPAPGQAYLKAEEEKVPLINEMVQLDTIQAAVVTGNQNDAFANLMDGRTINEYELTAYKDRTLIEYLKIRNPIFEYNGEIMYNRSMRRGDSSSSESDEDEGAGMISTDGTEDNSGLVKLILDETETPWWSYEFVLMDEIQAIHVSTMPDPYWNSSGGLVTIQMKPGGHGGTSTRKSLLYFVPLGYQTPKEFYSPRYDQGDVHEVFDHRNTIYWAPAVAINGGKADISFCNTDQMDYPYIVCIEGVTSKGVPFSKRTTLDFKEQL